MGILLLDSSSEEFPWLLNIPGLLYFGSSRPCVVPTRCELPKDLLRLNDSGVPTRECPGLDITEGVDELGSGLMVSGEKRGMIVSSARTLS